jgi:hypothetical protein
MTLAEFCTNMLINLIFSFSRSEMPSGRSASGFSRLDELPHQSIQQRRIDTNRIPGSSADLNDGFHLFSRLHGDGSAEVLDVLFHLSDDIIIITYFNSQMNAKC